MNQKLGAIDSLDYSQTSDPLAEVLLFNSAWYMAGQNSPWVFSNSGPRVQFRTDGQWEERPVSVMRGRRL